MIHQGFLDGSIASKVVVDFLKNTLGTWQPTPTENRQTTYVAFLSGGPIDSTEQKSGMTN